MNPIKLPSPARFVLVVLLALPCALCLAEDKSGDGPTKPVMVDPYSISIDFPGGPLSKLVASLKADNVGQISIIQTAGLDPMLPAFSVINTHADSVMAALSRILEPQGYFLSSVGPNLAVLTKSESHTSQEFASFQLESKLGNRSVDEVIAAIQAGCEFANPDGKPSTLRFKYHPGTKLLFVAGTQREVGVANRVFGSLPDFPTKVPPPPSEKK